MSWSLRLFTIGGTAVRVHVTFVLLLAWIWFMHYRIGGAPAAWEGVVFVLAVFACVVLHEFGHVAAARYFGIKTPDITLLPIGGVARLERTPDEPGQEFIVAIAGPLVNVVIAALIVLVLGYSVGFEQMAQIEDPRVGFLTRLAGVNIFLVLFNMIPAFPMIAPIAVAEEVLAIPAAVVTSAVSGRAPAVEPHRTDTDQPHVPSADADRECEAQRETHRHRGTTTLCAP
jgi:Zn-dependent protease